MQEKYKNIFSIIAALVLLSSAACVVTGADILGTSVPGGQLPVASEDAAARTSATTAQAGPLWRVAVAQAHLRSGPGTEHPATALLTAGQVVHIIRTAPAADGGLWANVITSGDLTGWVNLKLLEAFTP